MSPPLVVPIDDPDDVRIAAYRAVRERDVVGRGERFVAEGEVVLRLLIEGGRGTPPRHRAESVLLSQGRIEPLGPLLDKLSPETPVYVASQGVMDAIVGFPIHRGVLAIARRGTPPDAAALLAGLGPSALVIALVGVSNHDNVGGVFRNAAAFGARAVLLDASSGDPLYRKAIRVSVGASLILPFSRGGSGGDLLDALDAAGFETLALSPSGAHVLGDAPHSGRRALLLGAEGPGLPDDLMARTTTVRIPMAACFDSLNVATTSGVALYALTQER